jgi:hypothetical protein
VGPHVSPQCEGCFFTPNRAHGQVRHSRPSHGTSLKHVDVLHQSTPDVHVHAVGGFRELFEALVLVSGGSVGSPGLGLSEGLSTSELRCLQSVGGHDARRIGIIARTRKSGRPETDEGRATKVREITTTGVTGEMKGSVIEWTTTDRKGTPHGNKRSSPSVSRSWSQLAANSLIPFSPSRVSRVYFTTPVRISNLYKARSH